LEGGLANQSRPTQAPKTFWTLIMCGELYAVTPQNFCWKYFLWFPVNCLCISQGKMTTYCLEIAFCYLWNSLLSPCDFSNKSKPQTLLGHLPSAKHLAKFTTNVTFLWTWGQLCRLSVFNYYPYFTDEA
jgi:hypothetical protein